MAQTDLTDKTVKQRFKTIDMVYIAVGTVLIAVCSWISIPFIVPFTLQTFAVFFVLSLSGGMKGTISIAIYILLGAIGVPVFSGMTGGIGKLAGVTGGYIIGFVFTGLLYWLIEILAGKKLTVKIISLAAGLLVCYAFGTAWFMVVYARQNGPIGLGAALGMCVFPFILPDLAKLAAAVFVSLKLGKILHIH